MIGWAIVSIPSDTTPSDRKKSDNAHITQPVIAFSRNTSAEAAATTPTDASPCIHSNSAQPTTATISNPFSDTRITSIVVKIRISR